MRVNFSCWHFVVIFIAAFFSFDLAKSQGTAGTFSDQWKKVNDLVSKKLPKSALKEVEQIYFIAKKQNNDPQVIKALLYRATLMENVEEDASLDGIALVEKEITESKEPSRSILSCIAAGMYWNFYMQNRFKLYNRTKTGTGNFSKNDIQTWSINDFHKKIGELYLSSVREEKLLQRTAIAQFEPIVAKGNARYLRPTLYDLLAHRALEYFKNDERDVSRPAYAFEIKDAMAFGSAQDFASHKFVNKDSSSLHYQALLIFQKLLAFHIDGTKPDALIDADIERINFVKQYGVMPGKTELYINALQNILSSYKNNDASAQAGYLVAQEIFDQSSANDANLAAKETRYTIVDAKKITEEIIRNYPGSEGGINAKNLLNQVLHKDLNLTSEKVNIPGEPFRSLVSYKNLTSINLRILAISPLLKKLLENNNGDDQLWKNLTSEKYIRSWKQPLPSSSDYRLHNSEIKIDSLPPGEYALVASAADDFGLVKNPLAAQYFHVSNISYINNAAEYFVLHRKTGIPLTGATVQVWSQNYDYKTSKNILEKQELLETDKNGFVKLPEYKKNENRNIRLEITWEKDRLFLDDFQYSYTYYGEANVDTDNEKFESRNAKIFLFTDRGIYRPGQLVYFKGIGITKQVVNKSPQLLSAKDSILILLTDANNQKIDSIKLRLNEYGSLNGKFRLPENKLNGEFRLEAVNYNNSAVNFSVEEYKRPKFYTDFEKLKQSYRLNEKITVHGIAKAYAGNVISGAAVKYRVIRVARFLYPWMFWQKGFPQSQPMEIANGESITGTDGRFTILFEAIPDLAIDKKTDPVFDYKVEADVTDINGETRTGHIIIPIGYKAIELQINLPDNATLNLDSLKEVTVATRNLSGEPEKNSIDVKIFKMQPPTRLIRARYWPEPDQFVMTRDEYLKYFPNDEFQNESKKESWPKTEVLTTKADTSKTIPVFYFPGNTDQGWYAIEATAKDKYGQTVKDIKYVQLYKQQLQQMPSVAYLWNTAIANVVQPGESAKFILGSAASDVYVIQQIDKNKTTNDQLYRGGNHQGGVYNFYYLQNEMKKIIFPVTEDDRGGYGVFNFFVKDNRFYSAAWNVVVPWTNKQLNITFETFRDKVLPGSEEKWKVKISGEKGQKIGAEMLASMYDESLDQFKPHSWASPSIWPNYYGYNAWSSLQNFASVQAFQKWWSEEYVQPKQKTYDQLIEINYGEMGGIYNTRPMVSSEIKRKEIGQRQPPGVSEQNAADLGMNKQQDTATGQIFSAPTVDLSQVQVRKNFMETAFFLPELRTDKSGNIEFTFTMPEALTRWKLMALAHSKDLATGYAEKSVVTQKELMVQPNAPRFVREGDQFDFPVKIVNTGTKEIRGEAQFHLFNASDMKPVDQLFNNEFSLQHFSIAPGQSIPLTFNIRIPNNFHEALVYRIVAKAGGNSDGEESVLPVVTNRIMVTESMPLPVRGNNTKNFKFEKLLTSGQSKTLSNYALTLEFATNPAWYAVQALPYLAAQQYECTDQVFNRYFANNLAQKIANTSPKIKSIFEKWKTADTAALLSGLEKNQELKAVLLEETPWVLDAKDESLQKKNVALLFDVVHMATELDASLNKLKEMQSSNGGFVWFTGGPDDRYVTQYIVSGIGHLKNSKAINPQQEDVIKAILNTAIPYLDRKLRQDYDDLIKHKARLTANQLGPISIQFLYMRSFFPEFPMVKDVQTAFNYYREQSKKYGLLQTRYLQAMVALALNRSGDHSTPQKIIRSLKENSINNEELGMYWKEWNSAGYMWYQAPVESQAMMIEAFSEIDKDSKIIDDLKTWLLKNKQTNNWKTNRATAEACYALLLEGDNWLAEKNVTIHMGDTSFSTVQGQQVEAGTGYIKRKIEGINVRPSMGNILVTVSGGDNTNSTSPSWGAAYWQYFENLDKITFAETPLKLNKKLFIEKNTDRGPVLNLVDEGTSLKVGDKIKIRIELRVDRDMEYVHMKDMRASCMEPLNVISSFKYQGGLGYYETTKDVSTHFFFSWLPRGTYVFEYPLFVTQSGNFSNGITTIQSMYAPEFTSHSEGVRVNVGK
ncbi:MAG: alpha-2-macroglobulin family protein [Ginsengibacter sp.]